MKYMILIDKSEVIDGITVYPDDTSEVTFYVIPNQLTYQFENGVPRFRFLKYRTSIPMLMSNPDRKGAFALSHIQWSVPLDNMRLLKEKLQERINQVSDSKGQQRQSIIIGPLNFIRGMASANLKGQMGYAAKMMPNPGSLSPDGRYLAQFAREFTPESSTLFEMTIFDKIAEIQVAYDLIALAKVSSVPPDKIIEWKLSLRGTLPSITSYEGVRWDDHVEHMEVYDATFMPLVIDIRVNADFDKLPIEDIDVHIEYSHGDVHAAEEFLFRSSQEYARFESFIDGKFRNYKYWYQVHYKSESKTFKSPEVETDVSSLLIDVNDPSLRI
jgi:hypothetical protein